MQLNKSFVMHKRRTTKYKEIAEKLDLQCDYCKSFSQNILSIVFGEATISCGSCGKIYSKEIELEAS